MLASATASLTIWSTTRVLINGKLVPSETSPILLYSYFWWTDSWVPEQLHCWYGKCPGYRGPAGVEVQRLLLLYLGSGILQCQCGLLLGAFWCRQAVQTSFPTMFCLFGVFRVILFLDFLSYWRITPEPFGSRYQKHSLQQEIKHT